MMVPIPQQNTKFLGISPPVSFFPMQLSRAETHRAKFSPTSALPLTTAGLLHYKALQSYKALSE